MSTCRLLALCSVLVAGLTTVALGQTDDVEDPPVEAPALRVSAGGTMPMSPRNLRRYWRPAGTFSISAEVPLTEYASVQPRIEWLRLAPDRNTYERDAPSQRISTASTWFVTMGMEVLTRQRSLPGSLGRFQWGAGLGYVLGQVHFRTHGPEGWRPFQGLIRGRRKGLSISTVMRWSKSVGSGLRMEVDVRPTVHLMNRYAFRLEWRTQRDKPNLYVPLQLGLSVSV